MADPTNVLAVDDLKRRVQLEIVPMIATERAVNDALSGVHAGYAGVGGLPNIVGHRRVGGQTLQFGNRTLGGDATMSGCDRAPVTDEVQLGGCPAAERVIDGLVGRDELEVVDAFERCVGLLAGDTQKGCCCGSYTVNFHSLIGLGGCSRVRR